jgi:hypothetical protein
MKRVDVSTTNLRGPRGIEQIDAHEPARTEIAQNESPPPLVLKRQEKVRVGVDGERRDPVVSKAAKGSVAKMFAAQVQRSRERSALKQLRELASTLNPEEAVKTAKALGAGTFGAAFDLGNGFVLKHFGDEASKMGPLAATMPEGTFEDMATRQAAVHMGLRDAGFPCVAAAVVNGHPTWLLMQKADGLPSSAFAGAEIEHVTSMCAALNKKINPVVNDTLRALGIDVGYEGIDTDVHIDNARFARTNAGIVVSGFFDPTF